MQTEVDFLQIISYPLKIDNSYPISDYEIYILRKWQVREDDVNQVFDRSRKERIGWCIPVQSLSSIEHSYADNEHFLRYATVVVKKIFQNNDFQKNVDYVTQNSEDEPSAADFFHPYTCFLVICLNKIKDRKFNFKEWLPSLSLYGYVHSDEDSLSFLQKGFSDAEKGIIRISKMSKSLLDEDFITDALCKWIPFESNDLLRFFFCYQIIELLMERILQEETRIWIGELVKSNHSSEKTKKAIREISDLSKEQKRIALLSSSYLKAKPDEDDVIAATANFFQEMSVNHEYSGALGDIYQVRNMVFHGYRTTKGSKKFQNVVISVVPYLIDIVINFTIKDPVAQKLSSERIEKDYKGIHDLLNGYRSISI